jgi:hypothetical protein
MEKEHKAMSLEGRNTEDEEEEHKCTTFRDQLDNRHRALSLEGRDIEKG